MATASAVSEPKELAQRRKSTDTVCSSNSSCFLHKRKPVHPLASSIRLHVSRNSNNTVKQRVLSARLLKLRSLQNQLNDANFHLAELQQENRALKNLQTRQDKALSKYEGTNADLPRLLKAHEEEMRVLVSKNKTLRKNLKDTSDQLKMREEELASVREQYKNLLALTKHKNLGERHSLAEQVEELKEKLKSSDDKINLLNRKIQLEAKNYKYKLNAEMVKHRQAQKELLHALEEIDRLTTLLEAKGKIMLPINRKRFANVQRQSVSLTGLTDEKSINRELGKLRDSSEPRVTFGMGESKVGCNSNKIPVEDDSDNQSDHSDLKLETISNEKETKSAALSNVMVSPTESIKARLSASLTIKDKEMEYLNKNLEKMNLLESSSAESIHSISVTKQKSRPNSSQKLEKIPSLNYIETLPEKLTKSQEQIDQHLGSVCNQMLSTVKDYNNVVDAHIMDFQTAKSETEKLLQSLRETDSLNSTLRHSKFLTSEVFDIPEKDLDVVNEIWKEEYAFRKERKTKDNVTEYDNFVKSDKNGNVIKKDVDVALEDKTKLLATLRAIDNGEDV